MIAISLIIVLLIMMPVVVLMLGAKQREADRKRRIEEYRKSPESHILHLND